MINDNKYTFIATIWWENWSTIQILETLYMETIYEKFNKITSSGAEMMTHVPHWLHSAKFPHFSAEIKRHGSSCLSPYKNYIELAITVVSTWPKICYLFACWGTEDTCLRRDCTQTSARSCVLYVHVCILKTHWKPKIHSTVKNHSMLAGLQGHHTWSIW